MVTRKGEGKIALEIEVRILAAIRDYFPEREVKKGWFEFSQGFYSHKQADCAAFVYHSELDGWKSIEIISLSTMRVLAKHKKLVIFPSTFYSDVSGRNFDLEPFVDGAPTRVSLFEFG